MTSSDGSKRLVEIVGSNRGRRGKVVRMNVAINRSNDHRICLVGLDCHQLYPLCSPLSVLSSLMSPLCCFLLVPSTLPSSPSSLLSPLSFLFPPLRSLLPAVASLLSPLSSCSLRLLYALSSSMSLPFRLVPAQSQGTRAVQNSKLSKANS
jgi:hypothetical protein